ncbi:MAG: hypothetical protein ACE5E4_04675 [Candidatus Binatia bacterium]
MPRRNIPGPYDRKEMLYFLATYMYEEAAFLVDEVVEMDRTQRVIEARMDTTKPLPFAELQRTDARHPAHVAAGELIMVTGNLGCMHAWFFHGCRWDQGWTGFGNRIHRADFKDLARRGPPLFLRSQETKTRIGRTRLVIRYEFTFRQEGKLVYVGDQTAMFVKNRDLD